MKIALECEATKEPRASNGNWAYDMLNRITNINWTGPTPVTQQLTYDLAGNITNLVRENGSYTLAYDANDQLISSSGLENRSYVYDALGNRLQDSINGPGEFVNNFLKQNSVSSFLADQEGFGEVAKETTATQEKNYTYRADGKISGYQSGSLAVQYFYDGLDRLVAKAINDGNQYTQSFTHLEDENRVLLGKAGDNSITTYIDGQGMAERLAEVKGGIGKAYVTDHLGSVLNSAVAGVAKSFGLWGEIAQVPQVSPASAPVNYGFTGHMVDLESGLNRTEYRQYGSGVGRWLSQDPIGFHAEDENYYRYVKNMPTRYVDPSGLYLRPWQIGISLVISGAVSVFNDIVEVCLAAPNSAVCKRLIPQISPVPKPGDPDFVGPVPAPKKRKLPSTSEINKKLEKYKQPNFCP